MQAMFGAVDAPFLRLLDGVDHLFQILQAIAAVAYVADGDRIQNGGDTAGDHQRIVAAHRRVGGPVDFRARSKEFVQIIGMQLNQPGQQPAVFTVERLRQLALTFGKGVNAALLHFQRSVHHFVFENQVYIIDNHAVIPIGCSRSAT